MEIKIARTAHLQGESRIAVSIKQGEGVMEGGV